MGAVCSGAEAVLEDVSDMPNLPAHEAQHIFMDIQSAPDFVPHLVKVEFLRGKQSTVGACWLETRIWRGKEIVVRKSITHMSKDPYFTVCATFSTEDGLRFDATFTFVIEPRDGGKSCVTKWTIATVATGCVSQLMSKLCYRPYVKSMKKHVRDEMQYFYTEGLKRYKNGMETSERREDKPLENKQASYPRRTIPRLTS